MHTLNRLFITLLIGFPILADAQDTLPDTSAYSAIDSLAALPLDSLADIPTDSLPGEGQPDTVQTRAELEGPIKYWAEKIFLSYDGNTIKLEGNARIEYTNMILTAEKIEIDRDENVLYAQGVRDSVDSLGQPVYRGTPIFKETGEEPLEGDFIQYDFGTKRGKIVYGTTKMDPGYYKGERINKISDKTLLVEDGYFTSCEYIDNPHYFFKSKQMRVVFKDKVVARPIVFYIADVPLMALPFGIFPNKRGRHSGIVIPSYGESRYGGRNLRGMGYYWAPNDYFDATLLTDFYDKLGFTYRANMRYTIRYLLNGSLSGEYFPRDPTTGQRRERWRFSFKHNQTIDPTLSISGSGTFQSDKNFARETSANIEERLNQKITSNLSLRKRWKGTKNSLTASLSRTENLQNGRVDYTLPSVAFNRSQSSLWETISGERLGAGRAWYQSIYYSYNSRLVRRGVRLNSDTTDVVQSGIQHRLSFNSPQKFMKYLNLTPSVSYSEDWVDEVRTLELDPETGQLVDEKKKQFDIRRTFNTSLGANTTLYGLFEPNIGELKFIRHKMDPSISYTYTPDFSSPFYGYYDTVMDTAGNQVRYDRFQGTLAGSTPRSESQRMSIRLNNIFQAKLIDEEGKERKMDLFTLNFSTNYDFTRDSLRWSDLSSNFRTKILGKNVDIRATHSFYKAKNSGRGSIDELVFSDGNIFPRLLRMNASTGFGLSNKTFERSKEEKKETEEDTGTESETGEDEGILTNEFDTSLRTDYREETKKISIPWSVNFSLNYSYDRSDITDPRESFNVSARANMQVTKNWKVSWNARIDAITRDIIYQNFNIYRDLHCWEMSFGWQPERGYYDFRINIKSNVLQDIKLEKRGRDNPFIYR